MTKLSDLIGGQNYHSAPRFRRDMCNEKVKEKMGFWDGPSSQRLTQEFGLTKIPFFSPFEGKKYP